MPGLRPGLRGPLFQEKLALSLEKGASLCWRPSGANICFFYNVVAALHRRSAAFGRRDACLLGLGIQPQERPKGPQTPRSACAGRQRPAAWRRRAAPFCCQQGQSFSISACIKLLLPEA